MNRVIYFPALIADVKKFFNKRKHWLSHQWVWTSLFFLFLVSSARFNIFLLITILVGALLFHIQRYITYQKQKKTGKILSFKKKKNERIAKLYWFLGAAIFSWMITIEGGFAMVILCLGFTYLIQFLLYVPSIIFMAKDDELIITRKHKSKKVDFSYPNRLRFHNNRLLFIHPIEGQITWKDINMNRDAMHEIKNFLAENFGQEMVLNPTTGLPYVK